MIRRKNLFILEYFMSLMGRNIPYNLSLIKAYQLITKTQCKYVTKEYTKKPASPQISFPLSLETQLKMTFLPPLLYFYMQ